MFWCQFNKSSFFLRIKSLSFAAFVLPPLSCCSAICNCSFAAGCSLERYPCRYDFCCRPVFCLTWCHAFEGTFKIRNEEKFLEGQLHLLSACLQRKDVPVAEPLRTAAEVRKCGLRSWSSRDLLPAPATFVGLILKRLKRSLKP